MTRREREQVVELLRCAADNAPDCGLVGMFNTPYFGSSSHRTAWKVLMSFEWPKQNWTPADIDEGYRHALLEAAARVEEGSYP
jgi:hypothetical protein